MFEILESKNYSLLFTFWTSNHSLISMKTQFLQIYVDYFCFISNFRMIRVRFKIRIRVGEFPSINTVAGGTGGCLSDNENQQFFF